MYVVGHYDITTDGDITLLRFGKKDAKCLVNFVSRQQALTFVCIECDEVNRPSIVEQTTKSGRSPWPLLLVVAGHCRFFIDCDTRDQSDSWRARL